MTNFMWAWGSFKSFIKNAQLVNRTSLKTLCADSVDCHIHCNTYLTFFSIWGSSLRIAALLKKIETFTIYIKHSKVMARILKVRCSSLEGPWSHKYLICPCVRNTLVHNHLMALCWSNLTELVWKYQAPSELSNVGTNYSALYSNMSFARYQLYLIQIHMKYFWQSNKRPPKSTTIQSVS